MQIFFGSRTAQRSFVKGEERRPVDNGTTAQKGKRWGVELSKVKNAQRGFTIIELLIVVAIICIIGSIVAEKFL